MNIYIIVMFLLGFMHLVFVVFVVFLAQGNFAGDPWGPISVLCYIFVIFLLLPFTFLLISTGYF